MPVAVGDYVDMYAGIHHATNLGRLFRPEGEPLLPNWRHVPVGYHGRAGTVVVSGTDVPRPWGHVASTAGVEWPPSTQLDIELELGFVVGTGSRRGEPTAIDDFDAHVFGMLLVNDWSARDIQAFEYQPLGPFLGKSFMTSVSPWLVPLDALAPALVPGLAATQDPVPAAPPADRSARRSPRSTSKIALETATMRARVGTAHHHLARRGGRSALLVARAAIAHATSNGASMRTGDVFATGTLSGTDARTEGGSLIELTARGTDPLELPDGETRGFLADGDRVVMRGWCGSGSIASGSARSREPCVAASASAGGLIDAVLPPGW